MNFKKKLFQQSVAFITTTTPSPEFPVLCYVVLEVTLEKKQYIQKYELTLKYNKFIWVYQNNVLQLLTEGTLSETPPVLTEQKQLAGNKPF